MIMQRFLKNKKIKSVDKEIQKDLIRSEGEGYAVMYQSEKEKQTGKIKEKTKPAKVRCSMDAKKLYVKDIMTLGPFCCTPQTSLNDVARMMLDGDCGEIPVVNPDNKPVGVITDRDIVCRVIAQRQDPFSMKAAECMTEPCITIKENASIGDCCAKLEENRIRRIPVVDRHGECIGIVAQADIARHHLHDQIIDILEEVSQPQR